MIALFLTGCDTMSGVSVPWRSEDNIVAWENAQEYLSARYIIKANTNATFAQNTGRLMDQAWDVYASALNLDDPAARHLRINIYTSRRNYDRVAARFGVPEKITAGIFAPGGENAIHVTAAGDLKLPLSSTLLHEGTHQVLTIFYDYRPDAAFCNKYSIDREPLRSVPMWLSEGLATCFECIADSNEMLHPGAINKARLKALKKYLKKNPKPVLEDILRLPHERMLSQNGYAACWGLAYYIVYGKPHMRQANRAKLARYLSCCREGFLASGFTQDATQKGFAKRWRNHVCAQSLEYFRQIFLSEGESLREWEENWRGYILALR